MNDKLDLVLEEIAELRKQMTLIQAVLLELARPSGQDVGRKASGTAIDCPMSGCEDQCSACQE